MQNEEPSQRSQADPKTPSSPHPWYLMGHFVWLKQMILRGVTRRFKQAFETAWGMVLIQNMTQRKQAEVTAQRQFLELESIYATASIGLCFLDTDLRYVRINQQLAEINGVSIEQTIGRTLEEVLPELAKTLEPMHRELIRTGKPMINQEVHGTTPARPGVERDWLVSHYPLKDSEGRVVGINIMVQEITQRKQIERALQDSQERNQLAMSAARMFTFEYNVLTNQVQRSQNCSEILGLVGDEAEFDTATDFIQRVHPDDRAAFVAQLEALTPQQSTYSIAYRVIRPDQRVVILEESGRAFFNEQNQLVRLIGMTADVTERQQTEADLRESECQLRLLTEAIPQQIWTALPDGRVDYINSRWREFAGITIEQLLEKGWADMVHPDELANVAEVWQRSIQTGTPYQIEARMLGADGEYHWFLGQAMPLRDETGRIVKWYGTNTDIDEQKQAEAALRQSEERLRGFVDSNIIGILFGDIEGSILEANDEFLRIVGYSRAELEAGQIRWTDITPPEYLPLDAQRISEAQERGACTPYEKEYIRKDGTRIPVVVGYNLFETGRTRSVAFILDLTERKRLERTLRQQTEDLARANRLKDEFLAILSHELKTPLNPILGWTKLLRGGKLNPDQQQQALETIERNAKLQAQLVEDLLDISRILRGKLALKLEPVNLVQPMTAAIDSIRLAAEAKSITLESQLNPSVGLVRGDAGRLQQIVGNLLSNAVKFTPEGGHITIRLDAIDNTVQLQVSDTGKGIRVDFLPDVFERFRQEDGSTTRKYGGLGLGLAIVKQLVEAHAGTVKAESPGEGQGATFTVCLPMVSSDTVSPSTSIDDLISDLNGVRILIVDDDPDSLAFAAFVLEQAGAIVTSVSTASEVCRSLAYSTFDVFISDIGMPDVDGYTLIKQVRELPNGRYLSAIALTAYTGELNQQQALATGFQGHLGKPIDPSELVNAVRRLIVARTL